MTNLSEEALKEYVLRAINEDLGTGDATTAALGIQTRPIKARFFAKESGVAAGLNAAELVFLTLDRDVESSTAHK
jgi:nicotinate-nucleotide pyrophosphorylase